MSALHLPLPVLREPGFGSLLGLVEAVLREPASSRPSSYYSWTSEAVLREPASGVLELKTQLRLA